MMLFIDKSIYNIKYQYCIDGEYFNRENIVVYF